MVYLMPLFLISIAYIAGSLFQKMLRMEGSISETVLNGTCVLFLLWELLMLPAIKLLAPFSVVCKIYGGILLAVVIFSLLFCRREMKERLRIKNVLRKEPVVIIAVLLAAQFLYFVFVIPERDMDFTLETIYTTLKSDLIYENHPGMGTTFEHGITFRGKVVSLPVFYAFLARFVPDSAAVLLYRCIPFWVLLLSYFVYYLWAEILFGKMEKRTEKIGLFLGGIGILNLFGSFIGSGWFFQQMNRGYRGETIIFAVLVPYVVFLMYEIFVENNYRKILWLLAVLLTALCVTDIQRGFVPLVIAAVVCVILRLAFCIGRWIRCRK